MKIQLNQLSVRWKNEIIRHKFLILLSLVFLVIATIIDYIAGNYVTKVGTGLVPDLILDKINPIDLNFIFVYGWLIVVVVLFAYPLFFKVRKIHETINQFSLILILRSLMMSLTHLKTPLTAIPPTFPNFLSKIVFENDLFFSGHVAIAFLGFFLFNDSKIKWFFLVSSVIMAVTVLLMHRHYSIDVVAAFFIAYGSFKIGEVLIKKVPED